MKKIILSILVFSCLFTINAQDLLWVNHIQSQYTEIKDAVFDDSGNAIITGEFGVTVDFDLGVGTYNLTSTGGNDIYIAKYDADGNFIWAGAIGGPGGTDFPYVEDMVMDDAGNIFICGYFYGTCDFDPGTGSTSYTSNSSTYDIFFAKYNSTGTLAWVKVLASSTSEYSSSIDLDPSGNILLSGQFGATLDFNPNAGFNYMSCTSTGDIFFAKYDSNGNYIWSERLGTSGYNYAWNIASDHVGEIYISGSIEGSTDMDPGSGTTTLPAYSGYLAKFNSAGDFQWATDAYGGPIPYPDDSGNVYFNNMIKIDGSNASLIWDKSLSATYTDLALDDFGNILYTGIFNSIVDFDAGTGEYLMESEENSDVFVTSYDSDGNFNWAGQIECLQGCSGGEIGILNNGDFYVTMEANNEANFEMNGGEHMVSIGSSMNPFLVKYSQTLTLTQQPVDTIVCEGTDASFFLMGDGGTVFDIQWQVQDGAMFVDVVDDGVLYENSQTNELQILDPPASMDGTVYQCVITSPYQTIITDQVTLTVVEYPVVELGEDIEVCGGETVVLDGGAGTGYTYQWSTTETTQTISVTSFGSYSVTVTEPVNNCTSYDEVSIVFRTPYAQEQICMVTVDTLSGDNLIVWEKTDGEAIEYYKIHRESAVMGVYDSIGYVMFDSLSVFVDNGVDPSAQAYFYKITVVDSCGNESSIDSCEAHKTIHLQVSPGSPSGYELDWDEYQGFAYSTYNIYRANVGGSFSIIHSMSASTTAWTDAAAPAIPLEYRVSIDKSVPCYPTSSAKDISGPYSQSVSNLEDNGVGTNINELNQLEVSVFPNPANNFLNIESESTGTVYYEIINMNGQVLITGTLDSNLSRINVSEFSSGVYYIKINTDSYNTAEKFVIE